MQQWLWTGVNMFRRLIQYWKTGVLKINRVLKVQEDGHIGDRERKYLSPNCFTPPQMYSSPQDPQGWNPLPSNHLRNRFTNLRPRQETSTDPVTTCREDIITREELLGVSEEDQGGWDTGCRVSMS